MRRLHHLWLNPGSRVIRILLAEKSLAFELTVARIWEASSAAQDQAFDDVPMFRDANGVTITQTRAIEEYIEDVYPDPPLIGLDPIERAETRRLVSWFNDQMGREVTERLVGEKVDKRLLRRGYPDAGAIRAGLESIRWHLDYIGWLADRRKFLSGDRFSLADITAAAHLSCIDYVGDVPWGDFPSASDWYARIKSRPSFRPLLADQVPGIVAPAHYANLDF